ncbi:MAG TPA: glycosyltransferase family 39 protein, partial [Actinomycetes bacterium]
VVLTGLALRVEQYLHGRSLWFDEALLALNVIHRPLRRLLAEPLTYAQAAPPGFLAAQRIVVALFGDEERTLRLVPFLGGCLALVVFAHLAHQLLSRPAALVATALAAFSPFLVYYAAESKQYSIDVLFTVVLLDLAVTLLRRPGPLQAGIFGAAAAIGVVCSHPAALVAGGASLVLLSVYLARRDWRAVAWVAAGSSIWLATFAAEYFLLLRGLATNRALLAYWRAGFAPRPLAPGSLAAWLGAASLRVLRNSLGISLPGLAIAACLAGVLAVGRRGVALAALLLAPLPLLVAAAVVRKYPLDGRLSLFLVPLVLLLLAASVDVLAGAPAGRARVGAVAAGLLVAAVAVQPVGRSLQAFPHPTDVSETLPLLEAVRAQWEPGDRVAVETSAEPAYRYYAARLGLDPTPVVVALRTRPCGGPPVAPQLATAKRVWFVLSVWPHSSFAPTALGPALVADAQPQEQADLAQLQLAGRALRAERAPGAAVWLFQMTPAARGTPGTSGPLCHQLGRVKPMPPPTR